MPYVPYVVYEPRTRTSTREPRNVQRLFDSPAHLGARTRLRGSPRSWFSLSSSFATLSPLSPYCISAPSRSSRLHREPLVLWLVPFILFASSTARGTPLHLWSAEGSVRPGSLTLARTPLLLCHSVGVVGSPIPLSTRGSSPPPRRLSITPGLARRPRGDGHRPTPSPMLCATAAIA